MPRLPANSSRSFRTAFSLVEMLIAVGAVALISVGLAKLFGSVGKTVSIGKKVSYLNETASMMERQIRADLAAITRDGFMVIRHQEIQPPASGFQLNEDDAQPRAGGRRLDQIAVFCTGKFSSGREPQWVGRQATSNAARVYYGHGMKLDAADYDNLPLHDDRVRSPAWASQFGAPGPNQYTSEWTLLRHVTVLARPSMTENVEENDPNLPARLRGANWRDSLIQNNLQPAAPSIFRYDPTLTNLSDANHDGVGGGYERRTVVNGTVTRTPVPYRIPTAWARTPLPSQTEWPKFTSGMVDVASVDLAQIRNRVISAPVRLPNDSTLVETNSFIQPSSSAEQDNGSAHAMKLLMASALPSDCPFMLPGGKARDPIQSTASEIRMLYAPTPPDFTGNVSNGGPWNDDEPFRQQDQAMLSASNFVVGCTEFVVEWSWGDVYPMESNNANAVTGRVGQLIWHGLPRWDDLNGDGRINTGEPVFAAPYRNQDFTGSGSWDPGLGYDRYSYAVSSNVIRNVRSTLIHWPTTVGSQDERGQPSTLPAPGVPLYSFFGYIDPTYQRPFNTTTNEPFAGAPETIDWPWPKLLRFTITIVDPVDPTIEQTFQFVVEVPDQGKQ